MIVVSGEKPPNHSKFTAKFQLLLVLPITN
jgi:hypothetical protein